MIFSIIMASLFTLCFICLVLGLKDPRLVLKCGESEERNKKRVLLIYGSGLVLCFLLFSVSISKLEKDPQTNNTTKEPQTQSTVSKAESTIENKDKAKADKEKKENEKNKKILKLQEKYKPILVGGKDYANMTDEEGKIAVEMVSNWSKLNGDFKAEFADSEKAISASIDAYNDKKKKEAAEKKAAEEAASYDTGITYAQLARTPDDYKGKKVKFSGKVIQVIEGKKENNLRIAVDGNYDTIIFVGYDPNIISTRILESDYVTIKGKSIGIYSYESVFGGKISIPGIYVDNIALS